jgi:hypothetical protein
VLPRLATLAAISDLHREGHMKAFSLAALALFGWIALTVRPIPTTAVPRSLEDTETK